jgi:hypothetical protein
VWGKCVKCYSDWILEEDKIENIAEPLTPQKGRNVEFEEALAPNAFLPIQTQPLPASASSSNPWALPANLLTPKTQQLNGNYLKRAQDQRSPLEPNSACGKIAHTNMLPSAAIPPFPGTHTGATVPPAPGIAATNLHRICKDRGVEPPEVLLEVEVDSAQGLWEVTVTALGQCAVGTGRGKKNAKRAAMEMLEQSLQ